MPSSSVRPATGVTDSLTSTRAAPRGALRELGTARMKTRLLSILLSTALLAAAAFAALTFPASAQTVSVRLPSGEIVQVDVPRGTSIDDIQLPGTPVSPEESGTTEAPAPKPEPAPAPEPGPPSAGGGAPQGQTGSGERNRRERDKADKLTAKKDPQRDDEGSRKQRRKRDDDGGTRAKLRRADGTPTPDNPGFIDALPGPASPHGVPNFIISKFRVPPFLLPIYQAAAIEYGIRWEVLAA